MEDSAPPWQVSWEVREGSPVQTSCAAQRLRPRAPLSVRLKAVASPNNYGPVGIGGIPVLFPQLDERRNEIY